MSLRVELTFATMENGGACVMAFGMTVMPKWFAESLATQMPVS